MSARPVAGVGAILAIALACAPPAFAQGTAAVSGARPAIAHKPAPARRSAHKPPLAKPLPAKPLQARPPSKPTVEPRARKAAATRPRPAPRKAFKPSLHRPSRTLIHAPAAKRPAPVASSGVLAFADCYGRFIGWRDELSGLMLQANSYTPWPEDRARFDRVEQAFAASARRDRNLVLTLRPAFRETDFPTDVRAAFRAGLKAAAIRFSAGDYRHRQVLVLGQPGLSPVERMAQLEANTDEAFAPLAASCERLPSPRPAAP